MCPVRTQKYLLQDWLKKITKTKKFFFKKKNNHFFHIMRHLGEGS